LSIPENELDLGRFSAGKYIFPTVTERHEARNRLVEYLKTIPNEKKNDIVNWLKKKYAQHIDYERFPHYQPLNMEELRPLGGDKLITIGAHSRTHPILSRLDDDSLAEEIIGGKNDLERMTGREITHFAYPNGRRQDVNRAALDVTAGHFRSAVMTEAGLVRPGINKYLLPRIGVGRSLGMPEFKRQLSGAYHIFRKAAVDI
jgi:peptidoglycan/xylan/chitin deacetylase (PgdA/CDA1 family)